MTNPELTTQPVAMGRFANAFGLALFHRLRAEDPTKNLVASPFSVWLALSMLRCGAHGNTETELSRALVVNDVGDLLPEAVEKLRTMLLSDQRVELSIANALWAQNAYPLLSGFVEVMEQDFGAALEGLDFADAAAAAARINAWVSEATRGMIPELVQADMLDATTRLVLTNALYFKGAWDDPFEKDATQNLPFATPSARVQVPTMCRQASSYAYKETPDAQVLELFYKGRRIVLDVILPRAEQGLDALEASLTPERLVDFTTGFQHHQEILVHLPRFTHEWGDSIVDQVKALGVRDAFEFPDADFSEVSGNRELYVSEIVHKAKVIVDEVGTEAAAATAVMMCFGSAAPPEPPKPILFRADHPFLYLIRDKKTGVVLFMGRVTDPR